IAVEQNEDLLKQIAMIRLSEEDLGLMKALQPIIEDKVDANVDQFYDSILKVEALEHIISTHSQVDRLRSTLRSHLLEMFTGTIDPTYIKKRLAIALIHHRIGLNPKWYLAAFQNL